MSGSEVPNPADWTGHQCVEPPFTKCIGRQLPSELPPDAVPMQGSGRQAELDIDEVEVAGEGGNEEAGVVAPNLAASNDLQPVVDGVDRVLRDTVAVRPEAIIAYVVQVGDKGELVCHFPRCRDVI